jgi:heme exporter protein A
MQSTTGAVVAAENLGRMFGSRRAVDGVTLAVNAGEALSIFGPNGAGKTTLLRMLGGLLKPTSGTARIGDAQLPGGPEVRRRVGVISHHTLLYEALTARENVDFAARLYRVSSSRDAAERALARMEILDRADTPVRLLSRGMRQRVSIARATVHEPSVILADEPFTGLDVAGASALSILLHDLRSSGACLLLVTHNVEEGLAVSTHAAVMNGGRLVRVQERSTIQPAAFTRDYHAMVSANG